MLAILVAFGAALFIWFHNDAGPTTADLACHIPETVTDSEDIAPFDFTQQVFEQELAKVPDVQ